MIRPCPAAACLSENAVSMTLVGRDLRQISKAGASRRAKGRAGTASGRVAGDEPSASTAIKASSLATQVYETLRRRITEGRLPEDEPLVIASLVRELGVSQTPVREA